MINLNDALDGAIISFKRTFMNFVSLMDKTIKDMASPRVYLSSFFDMTTLLVSFIISSSLYKILENDFISISNYLMDNSNEIYNEILTGSNIVEIVRQNLPMQFNHITIVISIGIIIWLLSIIVLQSCSQYFLMDKKLFLDKRRRIRYRPIFRIMGIIAMDILMFILVVGAISYMIVVLSATIFGDRLLDLRISIILFLSLYMVISLSIFDKPANNIKRSFSKLFNNYLPLVVAIILYTFNDSIPLILAVTLLLFILMKNYKELYLVAFFVLLYYLVDSLIILSSNIPYLSTPLAMIIFFLAITFSRKILINSYNIKG